MAAALLPIIFWLHTDVLAWVRIQSSLTNYQNGWDEELIFSAGQDEMITGLYSNHDNKKEDRRWRFWTGSAPGVQCVNQQWSSSWENDYKGELSFSCGPNEVLSGIRSEHEINDRRFKFRCCKVSVQLINIRETHDLNTMDDDVHFRCGSSEVLSGLESYYHNWYHDRIWKATCVALKDTMNDDVMLTYDGLTDYLNG